MLIEQIIEFELKGPGRQVVGQHVLLQPVILWQNKILFRKIFDLIIIIYG